jgi:hypothetical protein
VRDYNIETNCRLTAPAAMPWSSVAKAKGRARLNIKISDAFVLATLLVLLLSAPAIAQRITSLTTTAKGQGTVTVSDIDKHALTGVLVILKENGEANITLYADMQISGEAKWSAPEDLSQGIDLKITGGIVSGNANGTGKLFLRADRKSIDSLNISETTADGSTVKVKFTAAEEKKDPTGAAP